MKLFDLWYDADGPDAPAPHKIDRVCIMGPSLPEVMTYVTGWNQTPITLLEVDKIPRECRELILMPQK